MERVLILGSPGAGKSTFARRLSETSGLPVVHLDQHYWLAGWREPDPDVWHETIKQLLAEPRWIMDGDYGGTLDMRLRAADAVFLLDLPRWLCILRVLKRIVTTYGRTRPDLADGCPERFDWEFLKYVWNYPHNRRPGLLAKLGTFKGPIATFRKSREIERYLAEQLPRGTGEAQPPAV